MAQATIVLEGERLTIKVDGRRIPTNVKIPKGTEIGIIQGLIEQAKDTAIWSVNYPEEEAAIEGISASYYAGIFDSIVNKVKGEELGAPGRIPGGRPGGRPPGRRLPEEPPMPAINHQFVRERVENAGKRDDSTAKDAATQMHRFSKHVDGFLNPDDAKEGAGRKKEATVEVFNALYKIRPFFMYIPYAAKEMGRAELSALHTYMLKNKTLSATAGDDTITAANVYIRYFLLNFVAKKGGNEKYREELMQIPSIKDWIGMSESTGTTKKRIWDVYSRPINADTITAASLYLRRWYQQEAGKRQEQIDVWKAPEVREIEREVEAPRGPPRMSGRRYARTMKNPGLIGFLGASNYADTGTERTKRAHIGDELQRLLKDAGINAPRPRVEAKVGRPPTQMLANFDEVEKCKVVVISGWAAANGINRPLKTIQDEYRAMFNRARGKVIIVTGVGPSARYPLWTPAMEEKAKKLNTWFQELHNDGGILFVDLKPLGEKTRKGLGLRRQFLPPDGGDGLHITRTGSREIARQIYDVAWRPLLERGVVPGQRRETLEDYAKSHWNRLTDALMMAVEGGKTGSILKVTRDPGLEKVKHDIPAGEGTLFERALRKLKRDDLDRAIDHAFNKVIHNTGEALGMEFLEWAKLHPNNNYRKAGLTASALDKDSKDDWRKNLISAMQAFINHVAGKSGGHYDKFAEDLAMLSQDVFGKEKNKIPVTGMGDTLTLCAVALYRWRVSNPNKDVGAWARGVKVIKIKAPVQEKKPKKPIRDAVVY